MFKTLVLLSTILYCNGQTLRFSPLIIGSNQLVGEQVIQLTPVTQSVKYAKPVSPVVLAKQQLVAAPRISIPVPQQFAIPQQLAIPAPVVLPAPVAYVSPVGGQVFKDEAPEPFAFAYTSTDEFGTTLSRQETGDANGAVTGSYSYTDAAGLSRLVEYIADAGGFRARVKTNEPGTVSSNPADVVIESTAAQAKK